jgi:CBS domain-containing protein
MNMRKILVSDVMTREPITTKPDTTLLECAKMLVKKQTGSLLLTEKKRLLGIISEYDILWAITKKPVSELPKIKAIDISPRKIATIKPSATIEEAMNKMKLLKFERLPVIQEKELVGIITAKDILNFNPELYPELEEFAKIREESRKLKLVEKANERNSFSEGICAECGNYGVLVNSKGLLICESCKNS